MGFLAKALLGQQISLSMVSLSTLSMYKVCSMGTRRFSEIQVSNRSLQHSREIDAVSVSHITICIGPPALALFSVDATGHRSPNRDTAVPIRRSRTCAAPALTKVLFTQAAFCLKNKKDEKMFTSKSQGNWASNPHRQFNNSNMPVTFLCSEAELGLSDKLL